MTAPRSPSTDDLLTEDFVVRCGGCGNLYPVWLPSPVVVDGAETQQRCEECAAWGTPGSSARWKDA